MKLKKISGQALELTETSGIVPLQTLSLTYLTVLVPLP